MRGRKGSGVAVLVVAREGSCDILFCKDGQFLLCSVSLLLIWWKTARCSERTILAFLVCTFFVKIS